MVPGKDPLSRERYHFEASREPAHAALRIELQSACPLYRQVYNQLRQVILDQKLSRERACPLPGTDLVRLRLVLELGLCFTI